MAVKYWKGEVVFLHEVVDGAADRPAIEAALTRPGSKARNERGSLAITKFISIGRQVWSAE